MAFDLDLFVIGGGSGGVRAARIASAEGGAKVALAEASRMGGTCVIRGCVPKKLMVFASQYGEHMKDAAAYGWSVENGGFDWPKFRDEMQRDLDRLEGVYRRTLTEAGVAIHDTRAEVVDPHRVRLATGEELTARHILVAVGGRPWLPEIAVDGVWTSDDMFGMAALPGSILIIGGGYISCEFACILNGMGVEVTQYYRGAQILRGFDDEARGHIAEAMRAHGVGLQCGTDLMELERVQGGFRTKATDGKERVFDAVLFATGRRPNTDGLGLAELGVKLGRWGQIEVDDYSQTAVPSIYAVGDVTDRINLTPVAIREGHAFARTVFLGEPTKADHDLVPSAVFTQPEMGTVGMTEEEARDVEPVEIYATSFRAMQTAFAGREDRALLKLVVSTKTRKVLGCHIVGEHAAEMIQLAAVAIKMGATKEDFDRTVAVHPSIAEEIVTLRKPVRVA